MSKYVVEINDNYVEDFKLQLSFLGSEDLESIGPSGVAKVAIANGVPLEDIKTKIEEEKKYYRETRDFGRYYGLVIALDILDNSFKSNNIITQEIKND